MAFYGTRWECLTSWWRHNHMCTIRGCAQCGPIISQLSLRLQFGSGFGKIHNVFFWGAMPLNESVVEKCPMQYLKKRLNGLTKRSRTLSLCSFVFFCLKKLPPPSPFLPTKGLASMISRT